MESLRFRKVYCFMIGFHVDMNIGHFEADYLRKWLTYLAGLGYDTILWEVEANVKWETVPECSSSESFTKDEFKDILNFSRELSLEPIPLLQTLGHCDYVLKNEKYKYLAEVKGDITQYCPRNPDVYKLLTSWIEEYLELFGEISKFHLGGDEAFLLGKCDSCSAYAKEYSLSWLYIEYIKKLCEHVTERGLTPVIWADMVLHYPKRLNDLSKSVLLFDWAYDNFHGSEKVWIPGKNLQNIDFFGDDDFPAHYEDYFYIENSDGEKTVDPFFTSEFLAKKDFDVVTCPTSSCYGDNVFFPRITYHLKNSFDSFRKGFS